MKQGDKRMKHKIHALEGSNMTQELQLCNYETLGLDESTTVTAQFASTATACNNPCKRKIFLN